MNLKTRLRKSAIFPFLKKTKLWTDKRTHGMMLLYSSFLKKGDLCFDIGANMGNRSEIFLGLGARVIAVEPQLACVTYLKKIFDWGDIVIVPEAVGGNVGTGKLSVPDTASVIATMSTRWQEEGRFSKEYSKEKEVTVPMTTLDSLIKKYGTPQFCKVDVEGFEEEVFKGLTQKIPYISFEFSREFLDDSARIVDRLSGFGDAVFNYSVAESHALRLPLWIKKDELIAKIKAEKMPDVWGDIYAKIL